MRFKTPQLRSDLIDLNDAYIIVTGTITATNPNPSAGVSYSRNLVFKNSAPFFNCILKVNCQLIEDAQDLDVVTPMYNLPYYNKNFRKTTRSFWNYYRDKPNSRYNNNNRDRIFYSIKDSKSFGYKTKLVGKLPDGENELKDIKVVVLLKYLSRFIWSLDIPLINAEIELILKWSEDFVLTKKAYRSTIAKGDDPATEPAAAAVNTPSILKFSVTDCRLFVPVVTLPTEYENRLLEELKSGFRITVEWDKCRSQSINQIATNYFNY